MKAAYTNGREVVIKEIKLPKLGHDQVHLKVDACGICGTDLHEKPEQTEEGPFGHEIAGTILEINSNDPRLKVGQTVVVDSSTPCGRCDNCRNGIQELCQDVQTIWKVPSFGFAEEMIAPAISVIPYEGLSPEVATLQEPLGVAIDMVRLANIKPDSNVLIMGAGPIGLMALALVKHHGVNNVYVSDFKSKTGRGRIAGKFGAVDVIDPMETPLKEYDFKCDIDRIMITSPPPTFNTAFGIAAKGAVISFIGIGYGKSAFCSFDANDFHFKKLQLRASFASPALYGSLALKYLREGVVDGDALVSHRFPLEEITEAIKTAKNDPEAIKVAICP